MRKNKKIFATILSVIIIISSLTDLQMTVFASQTSTLPNEASGEVNGETVTQEVGTELPSSVDLSESEYFPAVGNQSFNGNCGYWSNYYTSMTYIYNKTKGIKTTIENSHNPIFGYVFYGRSLEDSLVIATQIGYPTIGVLPINHYGTNTFSPYKEVWEDAIMHRLETWVDYTNYGEEDSIITGPKDASLNQMKQVLYDGGCLGIGTLSAKWNYSTVASGEHKGELIIDRCDGEGYGGHGVSIVGYNDDIWVDINYDGEVQEAEMGAFKVVNSWGDEWGNKGFVWVAYDALNTTSQVLTSSEETRINNAINAGTLKVNRVNNSSRSSFFMGNAFSTPKVREKDTSNCWCYLSVNTGSRKEMEMSVTATHKTTKEAKTYNFPRIIYDSDNYAWDGSQKSTDATMVFDLDNIISDISVDTMEDYIWEVTFGDTALNEYSVTVKDVYFTVNGVKKYTACISKLPLNGTKKVYTMALGGAEDATITEENKKNITIYYSNSNFDDANIHYKDGSGKWTATPGMQMNISDAQDGYIWKYVVNMGSASSVTVCFNNRNGIWDSNNSNNYIISKPGCYGIKNGVITELEEVVEIPAESIELDRENIELYEDEQAVVTAAITPADVTDNTVIWTSSDKAVATVTNGVITGIKEGTAVITASTCNGFTAEVKVTVKVNPNVVKPTGVSVLPMELALTEGDTYTVTATVTPANTTNKTVVWTSSDISVATVSSAGVVTAVSQGTATITATTFNGYKATATVTVIERKVDFIEGVYFEKPSSWGSNINVYFFSNNTTVGASWPGTAMTDRGDGVYAFKYTTDDHNLMVIFNDGSNQTADLEYVQNGYYNSSGFVKIVEPQTTGTVSVKYTDTNGNVLALITLTGNVGSSYSTSTKTFDGYTLLSTPSNATGTFTESAVTVTYIYSGREVEPLANSSIISATSITLGSSVTLKGAATGGTSPYTYAYYYKEKSNSSWTKAKGYSTTTSVSIKPQKTTTYDVCIKVKDTNGTEAKKYFTVKVNSAALANSSTISATSITLGNTVTVKGTATGGTSPYTYAYYYKEKSNSSWTKAKGYSTTTSVSIKTQKATTYDICIKVKDSTGTVVKKYFTLKVNPVALANSSTISATSITLGNTVTVKGTATGGTSPYQYSYYYKRAASSEWTTVKGYSTITSVSIKPQKATTYDVCVKVKDSTGTVVKKYFTLKVNPAALANSSTISATSISLGNTVTVKGTATGGTSPYQYSYYYKRAASSEWTTVKGYSTTTSISIKPQKATTYDVCIKVKDADGTVVKKYFTLKVNG